MLTGYSRSLGCLAESLDYGFKLANVVHFLKKVVSHGFAGGMSEPHQVIAKLRFKRLIKPRSVKNVLLVSALENFVFWVAPADQPAAACFCVVQQPISYLDRKAAPCT